jgi:WD40 repeat protein
MGRMLASGGFDHTVHLWETASGKLLHTLQGHKDWVMTVAFNPMDRTLASGSDDGTIKLWDTASGKLLHTLQGNGSRIYSVTFDPAGRTLASGDTDQTIKLWDTASGKLVRRLEGHTDSVRTVSFSAGGQFLASMDVKGTVCLWSCETWEPVAHITERTFSDWAFQGFAFHPALPLLATIGSDLNVPEGQFDRLIHIWELDLDVLLGDAPTNRVASKVVYHTTSKIVLVGDSGVGKTGLGWRLAHGEFKEHASTHGQQFWVLNELGTRRADGTECEAILWDLAGQPDYRLTHALFLDDADLALVLFDPPTAATHCTAWNSG